MPSVSKLRPSVRLFVIRMRALPHLPHTKDNMRVSLHWEDAADDDDDYNADDSNATTASSP